MDRKTNRFLLLVSTCSIAGVVLGGTSSWAESNQCLQAAVLTSQCLAQNPVQKTIEGMSLGLVAGIGAAVGATWQIRHED
jgi:hypothetical protein